MKTILLAGSSNKDNDPLKDITLGAPKAMMPLAGKPMIQWVLEALEGSEFVEEIIVVGLERPENLSLSKTSLFIPNQGSMLDNLFAAAEVLLPRTSAGEKYLCISADIPAVTSEILDWVLSQTAQEDKDFYYCVITKEDMEKSFPGSGRTYLHFRDTTVCGGDLAVLKASLFSGEKEIWDRLTRARKNPFKMASIIGLDILFLFLLRALKIETLVERAGFKLNLKGKVIYCPYPEIGMDLDKSFQRDILSAFLSSRK